MLFPRGLSRRLSTNRSTVVLGVLVVLCLTSMAAGTRASALDRFVRTSVSTCAFPFLKAMHGIEDAAAYASGFYFSYGVVQEEAARYRAQLDELTTRTARMGELRSENARLREALAYIRSEPRLEFVSAEVIQRTKGTLTIDRGSLHGVKPAMCAVTKDGIVGVVTSVAPMVSFIASLHHSDCRIGAHIERNGVHGIVEGTGSDVNHICTMRYIDEKDDVRAGDVVLSAGGSIFPSHLLIGVVKQVVSDGPLQRRAIIVPAVDPYRVEEVLLVVKAQTLQEELASAQRTYAAALRAPDMPDERTIQERFAP